MKIYGISGLGANERVFDQVNTFLDEPITYVPWITPKPKESLASYAQRLAGGLDTDEPFALVGLSFGGMLACEMSKHIDPETIIIISSAACRSELPSYFRRIGSLNLVPYIPAQLMQLPLPLLDAVMNLKRQESKDLIHEIAHQTDRAFVKWAVQAILTWDNEDVPSNLKRIHGKADRVLPLKVDADDLLDGGHMVIIDEPEKVARLIQKELTPA
ncbi:MAG: alpha/beta hydrolase [Flavobacteriales bacterium]|nr:alpha/beta hydrolase [Flavobacteriales bacterium]